MIVLLSTLVAPAHADEIACTEARAFTLVPANGHLVASQIDAMVDVRSAQA